MRPLGSQTHPNNEAVILTMRQTERIDQHRYQSTAVNHQGRLSMTIDIKINWLSKVDIAKNAPTLIPLDKQDVVWLVIAAIYFMNFFTRSLCSTGLNIHYGKRTLYYLLFDFYDTDTEKIHEQYNIPKFFLLLDKVHPKRFSFIVCLFPEVSRRKNVHQHNFNNTSFEIVLSLYGMRMNLCCKRPEPCLTSLDVKKIKTFTWFPKTPKEQAVETSVEPNQTAANLEGRLSMNACEHATKPCPSSVIKNRPGTAERTLIHAPRHVPAAPNTISIDNPDSI
ncbi:hypothetical protein AGLY_004217 [Aphis glycines]|uniref:Uncharacterized protein n=1 Tax=Aphis glycines TaxID=307491 RepID=A0A6G0TXG2_APHGL|nr:hypothetical protein AGLY_004217 [Aphis glycines]